MKTSVNSINIGYDDHGMGRPIFFLHAFPLNRSMWEGEMRALLPEGHYRLVSPDWRGFGESDITTDVSTMETLADDVAGLMDTLGVSSAVLCGLSMGGYVAFAFLRKYPERVAGLVLADTRPGADAPEAQANRANVARLALSEGTRAIADLQLPKLISDYTRQYAPEVENRIRQMIDAATPQGIAAASRGMALRADSTDLLAGIKCPTLVLAGEQDVLIPASVQQDYATMIPGAQFSIISNAGHLANLEQPQAFLQALRGFLEEL